MGNGFNCSALHGATRVRVWPDLGAGQEPATSSRAGSGQHGPSCTAVQPRRPLPCGCTALGIRYCTLGWCKNVHVSMNICTQVYSSTILNIRAIEQINNSSSQEKLFPLHWENEAEKTFSGVTCQLLTYWVVYSQSIDERRLKIVLAQCSTNKFFQPCRSTAVLTSWPAISSYPHCSHSMGFFDV